MEGEKKEEGLVALSEREGGLHARILESWQDVAQWPK